jgi:hypothetical protein
MQHRLMNFFTGLWDIPGAGEKIFTGRGVAPNY